MTDKEIISWLLAGDVSIQYQTYRDLLDTEKPNLRKMIESEGSGVQYLALRKQNGHWGSGFYQPKWTSTHYTLLELKNLSIDPENLLIQQSIEGICKNEKGLDGGINPSGSIHKSDVCINGMVLNYASYFRAREEHLKSVVDFLLSQKMIDGGFNCHSNRKGAVHSSLHTTLSVLEGILEYRRNGYSYRLGELQNAETDAREFILQHKLFRSDKTGIVINPNFLKLHHPCRWYYDVLKALDYFQDAQMNYDPRMNDAIELILNKRGKDGLWKVAAMYPGKIHFEMEKANNPSRWNTLRALRVIGRYGSSFRDSIKQKVQSTYK